MARIIGAFPSPNARTTEILDEWFAQMHSALQNESNADWEYAPYAANLVVFSDNK